jgi:hypothetical protein
MSSARISSRWAATLSGLIALVGALAVLSPAQAQEPVVDPPGRVARVSHIEGKVSVATQDSAAEDGKEQWSEAVLNRPLTSGDKVSVEGDGRVQLEAGSSNLYLDRQTEFGFIELDDDVLQMSLTGGAATVRVNRMGERETIQIETPNVTVHLRRPGEYHFEIDPSGNTTIVKTRNGEAEVVSRLNTYQVRAGEQGVFSGLDNLSANIDRLGSRTPFESWANDRERENDGSRSERYVSRDVIGYEDLDDHGDWISEPEYGHVWRPRYVERDWAPYRYGHWASIGPWGWTWIDDAPWGFAPFHYGRWAYLRSRWCWVPGPRHLRPVYAPALVGWVGGPSVSVSVAFGSGVGWFPLGPREVYVPYYRHTPRYVRYVNVSNTIIVNNNYFYDIDRGRHRDWHYRHRQIPDALTFVPRDRFVGGGSIGGGRVRVEEGQLRELRDNVPPPHKQMGDFYSARRGQGGNAAGGSGSTLRQIPDSRSSGFAPREQSGADDSRRSSGSSKYESGRPSASSQFRSAPSQSYQPRSGPMKSPSSYSNDSKYTPSQSAPRSGPAKSPSYSDRSSYAPRSGPMKSPTYSESPRSNSSSPSYTPERRDHMVRPPKQWSAPPQPQNNSRSESSNWGGGKNSTWSSGGDSRRSSGNSGGGNPGGNQGSKGESPRSPNGPNGKYK